LRQASSLPTWRKTGLAAILLLLLAAMGDAIRVGVADFRGLDLRAQLERIAASGVRPEPAAWILLRDRLLALLALTPDNAQTYELLGSHYLQRASGPRTDARFAQPYYRQALLYYRKASELRPTSAYDDADILLVKHGLNETDSEFARALKNAAEYGPWEPDVQRVVLQVGAMRWRTLDNAGQAVVLATAARAVDLSPARAVRVAKQDGYQAWLCEQFAAKLAKECAGR
jgi:hypothetical protein